MTLLRRIWQQSIRTFNEQILLLLLTHHDHVLDVPHIEHKTGAVVIGTESTENVMRAYAVPEEQLLTVRGGEDYQFSSFSLKVIPRFKALWTTSTISVPPLLRLE